jgi:hypothetical protein
MSNKPDFLIEDFWLSFKKSMVNFYENKSYKRPIQFWSSELNRLQNKQKYELIENNIRNYISLYAIDLMKYNNTYNTDILITNVKRWNKISKKYNFDKSDSMYHNIIFLLLDIYKILMFELDNKIKNLFSQVELFIIYQDFSTLIDYSIEKNKDSIIDKLNNFTKINNLIKEKYDIDIDQHTSGKKIIKLIKG